MSNFVVRKKMIKQINKYTKHVSLEQNFKKNVLITHLTFYLYPDYKCNNQQNKIYKLNLFK